MAGPLNIPFDVVSFCEVSGGGIHVKRDVLTWNTLRKVVPSMEVELRLDTPATIEKISFGYDGASMVTIEAKTQYEDEWSILVPQTMLRPVFDVSSAHDEKYRERCFTKDKITKSLQEKELIVLKITLGQPFEPFCSIGLNYITLCPNKTPNTQPKQKIIKSKISITNLKQEPPDLEPFPLVRQTEQSQVRIFHVDLIRSLGGEIRNEIPNPVTSRTLVLGDYDERNYSNTSFKTIDSDWIRQCHTHQKRIPVDNFLIEHKPSASPALNPSPAHSSLVFNVSSDDGSEGIVLEIPKTRKQVTIPMPTEKIKEIFHLPELFSGFAVGICSTFESSEKQFIKRYILAYGGVVVDPWQSSFLTHLILNESALPSGFQSIVDNHPHGNFAIVEPRWIFDCHNKQTTLPENNYLCLF